MSKVYKDTTAVDNVSFNIEANKIYGLLGRNGAGKTTIMHMITAQIFASRGRSAYLVSIPMRIRKSFSRYVLLRRARNIRILSRLEM